MTRDDARLDELEDRWLAVAESGMLAECRRPLANCPELIPALEERLVVLRQFHRATRLDRASSITKLGAFGSANDPC